MTQANEGKKGDKAPQKSRQDVVEETLTKLIEMMEDVIKRVTALEKTGGKKAGLFGGKRVRTAIKDTKTGEVHISKAACAKHVAAEYNLDPHDNFAWYKIQAQDPERFIEASADEKELVEAKEAERMAKVQAERQAELDAEAAKKAEATS